MKRGLFGQMLEWDSALVATSLLILASVQFIAGYICEEFCVQKSYNQTDVKDFSKKVCSTEGILRFRAKAQPTYIIQHHLKQLPTTKQLLTKTTQYNVERTGHRH